MNRRKEIIAATAALVLAFLLVWWLMPRPGSGAEATPGQNAETVKAAIGAPPAAPPPTHQQERKQKQEERAKTIFQAIEGTNVPIDFWGKVIDQNEKPIGGVKVNYSYSTEHGNLMGVAWGQQKIHKGETTTNGTGSFAVTGLRGHDLTIELLAKEGYLYTPRGASGYNFYGDTPTGKFKGHASNPVVFVMVNKATAEPLVSYGGDFGRTVRVPGDGTPVRWNLWKGEPEATGELQITFKREPAVLARVGPPKSWSAEVEVIGGGIVEASPNETIRKAPQEGYRARVDYPKEEQTRGIPARSFYVKTADGKYGRIQLHLYPGDDGPAARCFIKSSMNPSGSPILESGSTEH